MPLIVIACSASNPSSDNSCESDGALSTCLEPTQTDAHYIEQSHAYFDTMDYDPFGSIEPAYSERVARWEWPPWLKLTAFGREDILAADALLVLYPSVVPERDCRAFDTQPFGRCFVTFYYDDHGGLPCPIYEEFTFNDAGEITFIEAWSDLPGFLPMEDPSDTWALGATSRLSDRVPGLGRPDGRVDVESQWMIDASAADPDVADFAARAADWQAAWVEAFDAAGDDLWQRGCGW